jgi:hypothetical protein
VIDKAKSKNNKTNYENNFEIHDYSGQLAEVGVRPLLWEENTFVLRTLPQLNKTRKKRRN